jgi:hypothetical protein
MATHVHYVAARAIVRPVDSPTEDRIYAEYREMPGLCLTTEQAMRLWDLDRPTCDATLAALVRSGFLIRDTSGRFGLGTFAQSKKRRRSTARAVVA